MSRPHQLGLISNKDLYTLYRKSVVVNFLQNSESELDKILVDESMNQLEKEFLEISATISNIAEQIES